MIPREIEILIKKASVAMVAVSVLSIPAFSYDYDGKDENETGWPPDDYVNLSDYYEFLGDGYGVLSGKVSDEKGEPIVNTLVIIKGANLYAMTDEKGEFIIRDIPTGLFPVTASRVGFCEKTKPRVCICDEKTTRINLFLEEGTPEIFIKIDESLKDKD